MVSLECNILHIDMDAFFAAVEARDHPGYRDQPLIICGSSTERGIVTTASYAAREYGVKSAMPIIEARRLCPKGIYLTASHDKYNKEAEKLREIFFRYTPLVEPVSIDEAFLDVKGTGYLFKGGMEIGRKIKEDIRSERDLVASVGISYNKFLAKIASDYCKPDGLMIITPDQVESFLNELPVSRLWGVGKRVEAKLKSRGITKVGEIKKFGIEALVELFGISGRRLYELACGFDHREVKPVSERKSVSRERTFYTNLIERDAVRGQLMELLDEVTFRLRKKELYGSTLTIKIRFSDFNTITRSRSTQVPSCYSDDFLPSLIELLSKIDLKQKEIRLLGVGVSNLSRDHYQLAFNSVEKNLARVLDEIRSRYGESAIRRASSLLKTNVN